MKGQQKKLKKQLKVHKSACKKAKAEKKKLKLEIKRIKEQLKALKKAYNKTKVAKEKSCKAYKAGKEKLKVMKNASPKASPPKKKKVPKKVETPIIVAENIKIQATKPAITTKKVTTTTPRKRTVAKTKTTRSKVVKKTPARTTKAKTATPRKRRTTRTKVDNLKRIEGIGPKIEQLLHKDGIKTFSALGRTGIRKLRAILEAAGPRFRMHKPDTWARQSKMAAAGKFEELKKLQEELKGGRAPKK